MWCGFLKFVLSCPNEDFVFKSVYYYFIVFYVVFYIYFKVESTWSLLMTLYLYLLCATKSTQGYK